MTHTWVPFQLAYSQHDTSRPALEHLCVKMMATNSVHIVPFLWRNNQLCPQTTARSSQVPCCHLYMRCPACREKLLVTCPANPAPAISKAAPPALLCLYCRPTSAVVFWYCCVASPLARVVVCTCCGLLHHHSTCSWLLPTHLLLLSLQWLGSWCMSSAQALTGGAHHQTGAMAAATPVGREPVTVVL